MEGYEELPDGESQIQEELYEHPLTPAKKPKPVPLPRKSTLPTLPVVTKPQRSVLPSLPLPARSRSDRVLEELENRNSPKEDDEDRCAAPWLNQLQKNVLVPAPKPKSSEDASLLWVKKNEQQEDIPEFIKKARKITKSGSGFGETSTQPFHSPSSAPPHQAVKPRVTSLPQQEPEEEKKPAWLKQRERQLQQAKMGGAKCKGKPPPPTVAPQLGVAPPPTIPQLGQNGSQHPLTPAKKPKPVPLPRKSTLSTLPVVTKPQRSVLPSLPPGSVREKVMTLEKNTSSSHEFSKNSPIVTPKPVPYRALPTAEPTEALPPPLIPRHTHDEITPLILARGKRAIPQPPITSPPLPTIIQRDMAPPSNKPSWSSTSPPPPAIPQRDNSPVDLKLAHHFPVSSSAEPPPPVSNSQSEPTPTMTSLRYRRRPLRPVDPPIISQSTNPRIQGE